MGEGGVMKYVMCSRCGKRVSNIVSEEIVVRAFVECPECIQGDQDDEVEVNDLESELDCKQCFIHEDDRSVTECLACIEDIRLMSLLVSQGHTRHCACRQVWGDGECESGRMPFTTA